LKASSSGINIAETALINHRLTQQRLATNLGISRQPVSKFFKGESIDRDLFVGICEHLKLDWQIIFEPDQPNLANHSRNTSVDQLVQEVRNYAGEKIRKQCGMVRILDMERPIDLDDIYINVHILEKITSKQRQQIDDLQCDVGDFNRFGLPDMCKKSLSGLDAVDQFSKLMILGKPGSGKTTFLKRLALLCSIGEFHKHQVPLFITLREFIEPKPNESPDLISYILSQWPNCSVLNEQSLETLLNEGRLLMLMDGLDEVKKTEYKWLKREIENLTVYDKNSFVMTCRIAAREDIFEQFTEVEVADFNSDQILTFVGKWFRAKKDEIKGKNFKEELENHKPIQELVSNPLLLTFLCLFFGDTGDFPRSRSELYKEGLDVLLKKWDATRNIERDPAYKKLSLQRKVHLLSIFAFQMFIEGKFLFRQELAEEFIGEYISNLTDFNPENRQIDSENILKSIEVQHGLLVTRAKNIYSYSHLTFQEYFTACQIANSCDLSSKEPEALKILVEHLNDRHWREIFKLTINILQNAENLLLMMKKGMDRMLLGDPKYRDFMNWVKQKSLSIKTSHRLASVRVFYFIIGRARIRHLDNPETNLDAEFDKTLGRDLKLLQAMEPTINVIFDNDFALDIDLDRALIRAWALNHMFTNELYIGLNTALDRSLMSCEKLSSSDSHNLLLLQELKKLRQELPYARGHKSNENVYGYNLKTQSRWWEVHGVEWKAKLREIMVQYRNIGHNWDFTDQQKEQLQLYFEANQLLFECLHSDCHASPAVRQEIENSIMLPVSAIPNSKN
jgi:predicted NACHT family NTPase